MNFFKKLFKKEHKEEVFIENYQDFWDWFLLHEKEFFNAVKTHTNIEILFFDKIGPKLDQLKKGIFYLTGMLNDHTVDLILTSDGNVANFYFIEELVKTSPVLPNWKFRAHKPSSEILDTGISMSGHTFSSENLHFYANEFKEYPDEIDITIVHNAYNEENKDDIIRGSYIFLDNFLGELEAATLIDRISFCGKKDAIKELIPIEKLKSFIKWREKEFIEKYDGIRKGIEQDTYRILEATLKNGKPLIAVMNTDILKWEAKASHPWLLRLDIEYKGNDKGMPVEDDYSLLNTIEDEINDTLKDVEGYLNIGRETADNYRSIYFACKNYLKPCKVADEIIKRYNMRFNISFEIYKDKYWQSLQHFAA